jgi:signal transduction histidine kinase
VAQLGRAGTDHGVRARGPVLDRRGRQQDHRQPARIRSALEDALKDIRNLCKGLLLPEIQSLSFTDALRHMVRTHERGTGTFVDAVYGDLPATVPDFVKASLCRFVQESLNNSYRHANGKGQKVRVDVEDEMVVLSVSDEGPGLSVPLDEDGVRFGLKGLRDRIESVGGRMSVETAPGRGTRLTAHLPLNRGGADER